MQVAQLYPDRIVITTPRVKSLVDVYNNYEKRLNCLKSISNLSKKKSSVELSESSIRNITRSYNSLCFHSKKRNITLPNGKVIYNYKISFITLTLPSKQVHSDVEIKQRLNVFLQVLRSKYKVENYLWKAELQANDNIHFHLFIDKYINYNALKYYWNKALKPLGYIDAYQNKFSSLSLKQYIDLRSKNNPENAKVYFNSYKEAYAKGRLTNWRSPNSVDVRSAHTNKNLAWYLCKYIIKSIDKKENTTPDGICLERLENFGKVWARSSSLSRLRFINKIDYSEIRQMIVKLKNKAGAVTDKTYDYCRVIYLHLEKCPVWFRAFHTTIVRGMARMDAYPFPT